MMMTTQSQVGTEILSLGSPTLLAAELVLGAVRAEHRDGLAVTVRLPAVRPPVRAVVALGLFGEALRLADMPRA
jgi:hypothetical protein